ncbi:MAG: hypothetical protein R2729_07560 [Bryobacteraceae bacterium]
MLPATWKPMGLVIVLASTIPFASAQTTISVSASQLSFVQTSANVPPSSQTVSISGSATGIPILISGGATWLSTSLSSTTTPSIMTVNVVPIGLDAGTYTANLLVLGAGASNNPRQITVTLTVNSVPPTNTTPSQLTFYYTPGGDLPDAQYFNLAGTAANYSFSTNVSWLFISPDVTTVPQRAIVSVIPGDLLPGTYEGMITVEYQTSPVSYQLVTVTLQVDSSGSLWTVSGPLTFSYKYGDPAPPAQTLAISYASMIFFSAEAVSSSGWLKVDMTSGITPANLQVSVDPAGLVIGTYTGRIDISSFGASTPISVTVTLEVSGAPPLSASPLSLDFQAVAGGAAPAAKTFNVNSSTPTNFRTRIAGGAWLTATPENGVTPGAVTVSVNPAGLSAGTYRASVIVQTPGATAGGQLVAVSLTVTGSTSLNLRASPSSLQFSTTPGGPAPAVQTVTINADVAAQIALATSQPWLTATPASGTTPLTVTIAAVSAGLAAGTYSGTVTVSAPGAGQTIQIPVTLVIGGSGGDTGGGGTTGPLPLIREVSNGSGLLHDFAPGSIMFIYGQNLGPNQMLVAPAGSQYASTLGGVSVTIGGVPAPLVSVSATQILALVPFELEGRSEVDVRVSYAGVRSDAFMLAFQDTAPVLLTLDGSGRGPAAAVNVDGTINSPTNRAAKGSIVSLYLTGGGLFERDVLSGAVLDSSGLRTKAPVRVYVGGIQADLHYAGQAPGMAAGVLQINLYIPVELLSVGPVGLTIRIGNNFSQPGVTLSIQ